MDSVGRSPVRVEHERQPEIPVFTFLVRNRVMTVEIRVRDSALRRDAIRYRDLVLQTAMKIPSLRKAARQHPVRTGKVIDLSVK